MSSDTRNDAKLVAMAALAKRLANPANGPVELKPPADTLALRVDDMPNMVRNHLSFAQKHDCDALVGTVQDDTRTLHVYNKAYGKFVTVAHHGRVPLVSLFMPVLETDAFERVFVPERLVVQEGWALTHPVYSDTDVPLEQAHDEQRKGQSKSDQEMDADADALHFPVLLDPFTADFLSNIDAPVKLHTRARPRHSEDVPDPIVDVVLQVMGRNNAPETDVATIAATFQAVLAAAKTYEEQAHTHRFACGPKVVEVGAET